MLQILSQINGCVQPFLLVYPILLMLISWLLIFVLQSPQQSLLLLIHFSIVQQELLLIRVKAIYDSFVLLFLRRVINPLRVSQAMLVRYLRMSLNYVLRLQGNEVEMFLFCLEFQIIYSLPIPFPLHKIIPIHSTIPYL